MCVRVRFGGIRELVLFVAHTHTHTHTHTGTPWRAKRKCWINISMTPFLEYT
jgi:hypothetical protein